MKVRDFYPLPVAIRNDLQWTSSTFNQFKVRKDETKLIVGFSNQNTYNIVILRGLFLYSIIRIR